jgi:hypothetical protein
MPLRGVSTTLAKPIPKKKSRSKFQQQPRVRREQGWQAIGFDTSHSSLAAAIVGFDAVLGKKKGPKFAMLRWSREDDYYLRLLEASKAHELIFDLQAEVGFSPPLDRIFIAQEEPWPPHGGFTGRGVSMTLKQQAEISGAFLAGLLRYGYQNIWQIRNDQWRKLIADDLGVTIHFSKWRSTDLALRFNCKPADSGKFRAKEWALDGFFDGFPDEIPDWNDLINSKDGKIPRPEGSVAKAVQPDDRYDSLAILAWLLGELEEGHLTEEE